MHDKAVLEQEDASSMLKLLHVCAPHAMWQKLDDLLDGINLFEARVSQKTEPRNAKMCMKNVDHVARSISNSPGFRVLRIVSQAALFHVGFHDLPDTSE